MVVRAQLGCHTHGLHFLSVNSDEEMVKRTQKNLEFPDDDAQYSWLDDEIFGTPSLYTKECIMDNAY